MIRSVVLLILLVLNISCQSGAEKNKFTVRSAARNIRSPSVHGGVDSQSVDTIDKNVLTASSQADSLGPRPLSVEWIGVSELGFGSDVDTISAQFLLARGDRPILYYRPTLQDTVWSALDLSFGDGYEQVAVDITESNLDGRGKSELLLTLSSASYGSGSGTRYCYSYVLDVTLREPLLLLQAKISEVIERFPAYAAMHDITLDPEEIEVGCERTLKLRKQEIVVGPIETVGKNESNECTITKIPTGCYRYQRGKVFRVGK